MKGGFLGTIRPDVLTPVIPAVCKTGTHMVIGDSFSEVGFCGDRHLKRIACVGFLTAD